MTDFSFTAVHFSRQCTSRQYTSLISCMAFSAPSELHLSCSDDWRKGGGESPRFARS